MITQIGFKDKEKNALTHKHTFNIIKLSTNKKIEMINSLFFRSSQIL